MEMIVRNRLVKSDNYNGMPTSASDVDCPCKPCYRPHDVGFVLPSGRHVKNVVCLTRHNRGCPDAEVVSEHVWGKTGICKRCGALNNKKIK